MKFKIIKLANSVRDMDNQVYSRLMSLSSKIQRLEGGAGRMGANRRGKSTLILDANIMVGLILPSEVSYVDTIGKVELDYE